MEQVTEVLVVNPVGDTLIRWFAYTSGVFVVLGLLCIFWKAVRVPTLVALGVYFLLFIGTCVAIKIFESVDYKHHRKDMPQARYCRVTKHRLEGDRNLYLNLLMDGEEKELEFLDNNGYLPFYDNVDLGDRAKAQCIQGSAEMVYIVSLHRAEKNNP